MPLVLGLDIGTTHLGAGVLEVGPPARLVASLQLPNTAASCTAERAELDLGALFALVQRLLRESAEMLGSRAREISAIGIAGQQHGLALLGENNQPAAPAITWQDRRVLQAGPDGRTFLEHFIAQAGGAEAFYPMGCIPAAGYLGPSLCWLRQNQALPVDATACLIPDAVCAFLSGMPPVTDPTNAGSTALYDLVRGEWASEVLSKLGIPPRLLAPVVPSGSLAGTLRPEIATETGLTQGLPIAAAMGDNQASFLGSVRVPEASLLLNVGTGAQCSALVNAFSRLDDLDTRSFPGGRFLLVGAGLFGGRSYAYLQNLFQRIGRELLDMENPPELYERMNALAAAVPPGCDGLRCLPLFSGTRANPELRASFTGISADNFTPGHLTRALLEGMADLFYHFAEEMRPSTGARSELVGAGNGIRRNAVFRQIVTLHFGMPLRMPVWEEETTVGAALCAAVAARYAPDWQAASRLVEYQPAP